MSWVSLFVPQETCTTSQVCTVTPEPLEQQGVVPECDLPSTKSAQDTPKPDQQQRNCAVRNTAHKEALVGTLPVWIRPYVIGERLDEDKERLCASPSCNAVFMRQGQSDESWENKRYCCADCWSGRPSLPIPPASGLIQ